MRDKLTNTSLYFKNDESKRIEVKKKSNKRGRGQLDWPFHKGKM